MRRQTIILIIVLLMAGGVSAGYLEEYYGPPLPEAPPPDDCLEIEAWVPAGGFHDQNPWSMPSPEEGIIWFGTLCIEGPVAVLEFTRLGGRYCAPSIFNPSIDVCYAWHWLMIGTPDRHVMAWDPAFSSDWGFYQAAVSAGDWIWSYDSLTNLGNDEFMFVEGAWRLFPPDFWEESDEFTRWRFLVREKVTPVFGFRNGGRLRGF